MNKKGFTLIEIIFAIAVLSLISGVILKLYVAGYEIENRVDVMEIATIEAVNALENYKSGNYEPKIYYDDLWQVQSKKEDAAFERILYVKTDSKDERLKHLEVKIWDLNASKELYSIKTKYYFLRSSYDD
jgi:prepilin-type N-terminal cleavage/methylation domain-containing protein